MRFLIVLVFALAACTTPASQGDGGGGGNAADRYVSDYGGSPAVYSQIAADTDCTTLQATFDRASDNNDTAEPGSAEAQWTTGYMVAADARMQDLGCY